MSANPFDGIELHSLLNFLSVSHEGAFVSPKRQVEIIPVSFISDGIAIQPGVYSDAERGLNFGRVAMASCAKNSEKLINGEFNATPFVNEVLVCGLCDLGKGGYFQVIGKEAFSHNARRKFEYYLAEQIQVTRVCRSCLLYIFDNPCKGDFEIARDETGRSIGRQQKWWERAKEICSCTKLDFPDDRPCSRCEEKGDICRRVRVIISSSDCGGGQLKAIKAIHTNYVSNKSLFMAIPDL
jgi:hypothetical protein